MEINFENFIKFNIQVGTIIDVKENIKAKKPAYVIDIDFGIESPFFVNITKGVPLISFIKCQSISYPSFIFETLTISNSSLFVELIKTITTVIVSSKRIKFLLNII